MKIKENLLLRQIAGQWIAVPIGEHVVGVGGIISLNETGAFLWKKIEEGCTDCQLLAELLTAEYDVSLDVALQDVGEFVSAMKEKELLEL